MPERPRLWLPITCGWSVRNYLRSGFLDRMRSKADVVVWMPEGDHELEEELRKSGLCVEKLHPMALPPKVKRLISLLAQADNFRLGFWDPHLWKWMVALQPAWKRPYLSGLKALARWAAAPRVYPRLRRLEARWLAGCKWESSYGAFIERPRPDVILSTNPYSLEELPLSLLGRRHGIPTLAAIVSWDNLCYKGHLWTEYDAYFVWGPAMHDDLRHHLPSLTEDRIIETGSPQFDFHLREDLQWSREEFFRRIGGDSNRPLITYAANTEWHFPDEPSVVSGLWKSIRDGAVSGHPQLLVRLHPHDISPRFEAVRKECPGIFIQQPISARDGRYTWFKQNLDDLALLSNTLRYSDVTANLASSMALDAAIFDKPVINVAFSTKPNHPLTRRIPYSPMSAHYQRITKSGAVKIAYSMEELVRWINRYLADPSLEQEERRAMVRSICGPVDGGAIGRITEALARQMGIAEGPAEAGDRATRLEEELP